MKKYKKGLFMNLFIFYSVKLYPAHSRISKGNHRNHENLDLRHSVYRLLLFKALRVKWRDSAPRMPSYHDEENGNEIIKLNSHTSNLQAHTVSVHYDNPQLISFKCNS